MPDSLISKSILEYTHRALSYKDKAEIAKKSVSELRIALARQETYIKQLEGVLQELSLSCQVLAPALRQAVTTASDGNALADVPDFSNLTGEVLQNALNRTILSSAIVLVALSERVAILNTVEDEAKRIDYNPSLTKSLDYEDENFAGPMNLNEIIDMTTDSERLDVLFGRGDVGQSFFKRPERATKASVRLEEIKAREARASPKKGRALAPDLGTSGVGNVSTEIVVRSSASLTTPGSF